jgi:hypothetical protein
VASNLSLLFSAAGLLLACASPADRRQSTPAQPVPDANSSSIDAGAAASVDGGAWSPLDAGAPTCEQGDRTVQRYGTDCLCCHAWEFGAAGSVDKAGSAISRIEATDRDGVTAVMYPNGLSNFFQHYPLAGPLRVVAYGPDGRSIAMQEPAPDGACNRCHRPQGAAPRIHGP